MATERRLDDFAGTWHIARQITFEQGPPATFSGVARWQRRDAQAMLYSERGQLQVAGQTPLMAERHYVWDADLAVWFDDGRFFHRVPPAGGAVRHWCDPDEYRGLYTFAAWPAFTVQWDVAGPRKAYRMVSQYTRPADP